MTHKIISFPNSLCPIITTQVKKDKMIKGENLDIWKLKVLQIIKQLVHQTVTGKKLLL